jgi:hypothetical protein
VKQLDVVVAIFGANHPRETWTIGLDRVGRAR